MALKHSALKLKRLQQQKMEEMSILRNVSTYSAWELKTEAAALKLTAEAESECSEEWLNRFSQQAESRKKL
jgi:hypothetical protein